MSKDIRPDCDILYNNAVCIRTESMSIRGPDHDENPGCQLSRFTIDVMTAATLRDPENLGKIMPVKRKSVYAAKQGT